MFDHLGSFDPVALKNIYEKIDHIKRHKRDYVVNESALAPFRPAADATVRDIQLAVTGLKHFTVGDQCFTEEADAKAYADTHGADVEQVDAPPTLTLSRTALGQLCERHNLPLRTLDAWASDERDDLLLRALADSAKRSTKKCLVRTLEGRVRAIRGNGYRCLDNADLFVLAAEEFSKVNAQLWKARVWDDGGKFELLGVAPHIAGAVTLDRTFDPGDGWQSRWAGDAGDVHNAAVRITNSETGDGSLGVSLAIMRKVCANFNVWGDKVAFVHAGKRLTDDGLILSNETREAEDKVIWLKVRDAIRTAFDKDKFQNVLDKLNGLTREKIGAAEPVVAAVATTFAIDEATKADILQNLFRSGDGTRFGLVQAVTAAAHSADGRRQAELASRLEEIGGRLTDMSQKEFAAMTA